ncbi:MAG: hypothetical protein IKJ42_09735 [Bacteroidaceae bacterium]|nr:hypothetical protein [Bacteroidaceae bacterium]MBR3897268.1 hypothetical protein [Bacteroidaceae bacterium]
MKSFAKSLMLLGCAVFFCISTLYAKGDKPAETQTVYIFGIAASFGDTIVYITDIQEIQGTALVNKGFLEGRNMYSYQLKSYLENGANLPNRTCTVFFSEKKSKLEKTYAKLKQKYQSDKSISCRMLDAQAFSFEKYELEY